MGLSSTFKRFLCCCTNKGDDLAFTNALHWAYSWPRSRGQLRGTNTMASFGTERPLRNFWKYDVPQSIKEKVWTANLAPNLILGTFSHISICEFKRMRGKSKATPTVSTLGERTAMQKPFSFTKQQPALVRDLPLLMAPYGSYGSIETRSSIGERGSARPRGSAFRLVASLRLQCIAAPGREPSMVLAAASALTHIAALT